MKNAWDQNNLRNLEYKYGENIRKGPRLLETPNSPKTPAKTKPPLFSPHTPILTNCLSLSCPNAFTFPSHQLVISFPSTFSKFLSPASPLLLCLKYTLVVLSTSKQLLTTSVCPSELGPASLNYSDQNWLRKSWSLSDTTEVENPWSFTTSEINISATSFAVKGCNNAIKWVYLEILSPTTRMVRFTLAWVNQRWHPWIYYSTPVWGRQGL